MQTLDLSNYGAVKMSFGEMQGTEVGQIKPPGGDFWGIAWEVAKYCWPKADEIVGDKGGSGAYHDVMSSSNHRGIR